MTALAATPLQSSASARRPDHESREIRVRALACALLQLVLLAIYPFAALAARAARMHATHRHGARLERTRRWRRSFSAELVFAAIERDASETSTPHRYVYEWDIGPITNRVTPDGAMTILKSAPDLIFPFGVTGGTRIELNQVLDLEHVRWPRDNGNPVLVSQADSTSFTFLTLPGHFRGPGRTIQFTILERGGRLILRQVGATSRGISDIAYDGGAWFSWRTQAATLRAAISGSTHGPDLDVGLSGPPAGSGSRRVRGLARARAARRSRSGPR